MQCCSSVQDAPAARIERTMSTTLLERPKTT
jgi:hypothetical protein